LKLFLKNSPQKKKKKKKNFFFFFFGWGPPGACQLLSVCEGFEKHTHEPEKCTDPVKIEIRCLLLIHTLSFHFLKILVHLTHMKQKSFISTPINRTQYLFGVLSIIALGIVISHFLSTHGMASASVIDNQNSFWNYPSLAILLSIMSTTLAYKRLLDFSTHKKALKIVYLLLAFKIVSFYTVYSAGFHSSIIHGLTLLTLIIVLILIFKKGRSK
jgi:hypothetical protein